jgi:Methyltransferase domain
MNPNDTENKQSMLRLIAEIHERAKGLNDVSWSQADLVANKEILTSASARIHEGVDLITKNFQWYQRIGWKQFLLNRDQVELTACEDAAREEKERFRDWLAVSPSALDFYRTIHRQVPEDLVAKAARAYQVHTLTALDVGCRDGGWLKYLLGFGAPPTHLAGIEPHQYLWQEARATLDGKISVVSGYPDNLPFRDHHFNLVLAFGTFMLTLDQYLQRKIGAELLRVLHPQGTILVVNATDTVISALEPYISFATRSIQASDLAGVFPDCTIEVETVDPISIATIRFKHEG